MTTWIRVAPEIAAQHPLAKVRGWALVLVVALGWNVLMSWVVYGYLIQELRDLAAAAAATEAGDPLTIERDYYADPDIGAVMRVVKVQAWVTTIVCIMLVTMLFNRRPAFIGFYTLAVACSVAAMVYIVSKIGGGAAMAMALGAPLAWLLYVWRSRRIRVLTRNELRTDDPLLRAETPFLDQDEAPAQTESPPRPVVAPPAAISAPAPPKEPIELTLPGVTERYAVALEGRTLGNRPAADVAAALATLFQRSPAEMEGLLGGSSTTIKRGLDLATAQRYRAELEDRGAACRLERDG